MNRSVLERSVLLSDSGQRIRTMPSFRIRLMPPSGPSWNRPVEAVEVVAVDRGGEDAAEAAVLLGDAFRQR